MKRNNLLIKKLILNINKIIDLGIKESEINFKNKKKHSKNKKEFLEKEFIEIIKEFFKDTKKNDFKKIELISNYNTLSTILDRLSVEKTKYHHFRYNMKSALTENQISKKCKNQKNLIKNINLILEEKFEEVLKNKIIINKEERTFT